ncbi:DUF397 domain-containing protein [Haloechinothrix sp. LS1_15]|uniref:DUF397 domain-containing protein n=1 Tax=Haloechinothrix sp. LS1_15 TaxID=2652248 RepID=UPI002944B1A1|nr:DUF397 domain-containing protein [Haloechinothrix sp. LS1_15]MDV6010984.1 DUF397 domain-containing protein [Haloechinothrix sp. LS1_15]
MTHYSEWRTARYSSGGGQCVEVSLGPTARVRDTKDRDGGTLDVPATAWQVFTAALRG